MIRREVSRHKISLFCFFLISTVKNCEWEATFLLVCPEKVCNWSSRVHCTEGLSEGLVALACMSSCRSTNSTALISAYDALFPRTRPGKALLQCHVICLFIGFIWHASSVAAQLLKFFPFSFLSSSPVWSLHLPITRCP